MSSYENILVEVRDAVLRVQINRPGSHNALSRATLTELGRAFAACAAEPTLKAVVLTGAGNESFAAGGDVKEFALLRTAEQAGELFDLANSGFDQVRDFPVPVVAAINGWALGGGAELAMACDYRIGAANASIGFIQARLNITTGFGGGTDLMRALGSARAMRYGLSAKTLNADEALRIGLLDAVAADGEPLEQAVDEFLEPILRQRPQVIRGYKAMAIAERRGLPSSERRAIEREWFSRTWAHADHWAAVDAMSQKQLRTK